MKKFLTLFFVFAMVTAFTVGCSTQSTIEQQAKKNHNKITIGFAISTTNNPFFVTMKEAAEKAAKDAGADLIVVDAQDDSAKQISSIEDLIQKGVDVLIVNPTDGKAIKTAIESANKANIPVITVDRAAEGGKVVSHIASDNVKGGEMAAEFIVKQLNGKGKVAELQGIVGTSAARDRGKGFHDVIDRQPNIKVVAQQPADFDRAKGLSVMENILQSHPDIQAVFAHNDEMALGALKAIQAAKKNILVVGFDGTEEAVKAVQSGQLAATVAQKPDLMGQKAIEVALKVVKGEKVDPFYPVELELITKK